MESVLQNQTIKRPMHVHVILPAFNEEQNIDSLISDIHAFSKSVDFPLRVTVIDDGSSDATVKLSKNAGAETVCHERNRGLGAGVRTGIAHVLAEASEDDALVLLDADNSHKPHHIKEMVRLLDCGNDVVIASRYAQGGKEIGLVLTRRLGSRVVSKLLQSVFSVKGARDYTCGFRAYRVAALRKALAEYGDNLISENSFVCMAELLIKLDSVGARICETPLVLRYDLKNGASKMHIYKTVWRYIVFIIQQKDLIKQVREKYSFIP